MKRQIAIQDIDHRQLQDSVLEEWQERAAQLHPSRKQSSKRDSPKSPRPGSLDTDTGDRGGVS